MLESDVRLMVWLTTGVTMDPATSSVLEVIKTQIGVEVSPTVTAHQKVACISTAQVAGMISPVVVLSPSSVDYLSARENRSSPLAPSQ
jgi:hypothetical protein